ncbi:hypothetical protein [Streptosporangium saharense]
MHRGLLADTDMLPGQWVARSTRAGSSASVATARPRNTIAR